MTQTQPDPIDFRRRLLAREHVLGTFIKMPVPHITEMLGLLGFDFTIVDQEHAPLDLGALDMMCLAARAARIAAIVRVADPTPASILSVLDMGATGVMVPHVDHPEKARMIGAACRYRNGTRGFANTTRAGAYGGASFEDHMNAQDAQVTCIAMIEDAAAIPHLDAIAAAPGVDAFFIGRGDLTAALGVEGMKKAVDQITAAGRRTGKIMIALVSGKDDARAMRAAGVSGFVHSNDQNLFRSAAAQAKRDYGDPAAW